MDHPWIDCHIHVSDTDTDGRVRIDMSAHLLEILDRCDADLRLILSPDFPYINRMAEDPGQMLAANRMIHELVRQAPDRLFGACMVNPNFADESVRVMERCFGEWGFVMLGEMLPYLMDYHMDSRETEQVVRRAVDFDVPIQVHLGTYWHRDHAGSTDGMIQMRELLRVAERVPEGRYILAHAIGVGPSPEYIPWAGMFLDTLGGVFQDYPRNFWVEIRDFHAPALGRALAEVPLDRLLAGTDWTTRVGPPFQSYGTVFEYLERENPYPPSVSAMTQFLKKAGAAEADIRLIACDNASNLFRILRPSG